MGKICLQCGHTNDDDSKFCVRCGTRLPELSENGADGEKEENKVCAEWQGDDCRCEFGKGAEGSAPPAGENYGQPSVSANGTPYVAPNGRYQGGFVYGVPAGEPGNYAAQRRQWLETTRKARVAGKRKALFVLAFVGLLLDFLCGIGALMCLPVAIISSVELNKMYKEEKKTSTQLVWATVVGYVGALLGGLFLVLMIR